MKPAGIVILLISLVFVSSCYRARDARPNAEPVANQQSLETNSKPVVAKEQSAGTSLDRSEITDQEAEAKLQPAVAQHVSLMQADQSQSMAEAMDRKIIRNADLTIEVGVPAEVQRKIASVAELLGGFVVTSESKQRQTGDGKEELEVNLVVRMPATQFGVALNQIRNAGSRVIQEKITGQDVTEEFIDLEARVRTQKALESQFLEIMKQAHRVVDALEVQRQIADVRTEIEKLEGRKRFLENRASLSTITVSLQSPAAVVVNTSGFGRSIREAVIDSVDVATGIVLFFIRFAIVMIPIFILVILPGWLFARYFVRRAKKMQFARQPVPATISDSQSD